MRFHTIIINGEPEWGVTSRELALFLKRRHKHILRDIRVFLSRKSLSFCVFHFEEKTYRLYRSQEQPEYVLTEEAAKEFLRLRQAGG